MRRFCFLHPSVNSLDDFKSYIYVEELLDGIDIVWDMENPEVCIATEHIYFNRTYWNLFKKLSQTSVINVFYSIEAISVDYNLFDIGITFDSSLGGKRFCQVLPPEDYFDNFISKKENEIETKEQARELLRDRAFCNFLYSNYNAHPMRDILFYKISKYKKVDSLGKHLNNVGKTGTGWHGHSSECVKIKSRYKFSIACENAWFPGYTTEKLLTSLEAHTVPIYFGNKDVAADVNPLCYINVMEYKTTEDVIAKIIEIDTDDDLWCEMISQPWYLPSQQKQKEERRIKYYNMMRKLFTEDLNLLKYRGNGTMEYKYHDFFYRKGIRNKYSMMCDIFEKKIKNEWLKRFFIKQ